MPSTNDNPGFRLDEQSIRIIEQVVLRVLHEQLGNVKRGSWRPYVQGLYWGTLDEDLNHEDQATMSVKYLNSSHSTVDSTYNMEVFDVLLASGKKLSSGATVIAGQMGNHGIVIASSECQEDV